MTAHTDISTLRFQYVDTPERRLLNLEQLGIAGVPCIGFCHYQRSRPEIPEHHHPNCTEISFLLRSTLTYQDADNSFELLPDMILATPPNLPHSFSKHSKGLIMNWIILRTPPINPHLLGLPPPEAQALNDQLLTLPRQPFAATAAIRQTFQRLFALYDSPNSPYRRCAIRGNCIALLLAIIEASETYALPTEDSAIQHLVTQMRIAPENNYPVPEAAENCGLTTGHFINRFKALTGLPPHQFLLSCRIEEAKTRLLESTHSITEIALDLGFSSSSHFATLFKQQTSTTPTNWRSGCNNLDLTTHNPLHDTQVET